MAIVYRRLDDGKWINERHRSIDEPPHKYPMHRTRHNGVEVTVYGTFDTPMDRLGFLMRLAREIAGIKHLLEFDLRHLEKYDGLISHLGQLCDHIENTIAFAEKEDYREEEEEISTAIHNYLYEEYLKHG